jgi:hypothetical protein
VRRKLAGAHDGNRQMVDILSAVLTDGLPAVEAACAEAIRDDGRNGGALRPVQERHHSSLLRVGTGVVMYRLCPLHLRR